MTYPQNDPWRGQTYPTYPTAYGQQPSFMNYGNPGSTLARREGPYTPYEIESSIAQVHNQLNIVGSQWNGASPQVAGHDSTQVQDQTLWSGVEQTPPQPIPIYNESGSVDLFEQYDMSVDGSEAVELSFEALLADEGSETLFPDQSEALDIQAAATDAQPVEDVNVVTEQIQQSSQSSDESSAAILNDVASFVNATPPAPIPATPSPDSRKRKRSAESISTASSKKSRAEKAEEKKAEKERLAAKRKAEEPPFTAEQEERSRRLKEIGKKRENGNYVTEEELRIFHPDVEVKSLREQFAGFEDTDQLSNDEFRRKYFEQPKRFEGNHSAWLDKVNRAKAEQRRNNRRKRREMQK